MTEPFSVVKAVDLTLPALGKSVSVVIKGLLVLALIAGLVWGVYVVMIKPHTNPCPTTSQSGTITNITNNYPKTDKKFFIGVRVFGIDVGIGK